MQRLLFLLALCAFASCQYDSWHGQTWQQTSDVQYWPQQQRLQRQYYPQQQRGYPDNSWRRQQQWQDQQQQQTPYFYYMPDPYNQQTPLYESMPGQSEISSRFPQAQQKKAIVKLGGDRVNGNVTFTQVSNGVRVSGTIFGLPQGRYGFHVHEKGDITGGCLSAAAHFNPYNQEHGAPTDHVRHVGDLGNVEFGPDQAAHIDFVDPVISLDGPNNIIGRTLVLHSDVDDLGRTGHPDSKKTGNAGSRVSCGVIGIL